MNQSAAARVMVEWVKPRLKAPRALPPHLPQSWLALIRGRSGVPLLTCATPLYLTAPGADDKGAAPDATTGRRQLRQQRPQRGGRSLWTQAGRELTGEVAASLHR